MQKQFDDKSYLDHALKSLDEGFIWKQERKNKLLNQLLSNLNKVDNNTNLFNRMKYLSSIGALIAILFVGVTYFSEKISFGPGTGVNENSGTHYKLSSIIDTSDLTIKSNITDEKTIVYEPVTLKKAKEIFPSNLIIPEMPFEPIEQPKVYINKRTYHYPDVENIDISISFKRSKEEFIDVTIANYELPIIHSKIFERDVVQLADEAESTYLGKPGPGTLSFKHNGFWYKLALFKLKEPNKNASEVDSGTEADKKLLIEIANAMKNY